VAGVRLVLAARPWYPLGDLAIIELTTRDVGHHQVLLGPYSRFGWHHPGPAMFVLLATPYRLLGRSSGLMLGAVLINLAAAAGVVMVVAREGGERALRFALPVLGLLLVALGAERLRDPWNPSLAIVAVALFVLAAWRLAGGTRWWLPVAVALGSAVVQTHVGYLLTVVAVLAVASGMAVRTSGWAVLRRPALVGAGVVAALWALPLWEQLTRSPGNVTLLVRYLRVEQSSWSPIDGLRVAVTRFGALPAQVAGVSSLPDPRTLAGASPWWGVGTLVALGVATVGARRTGGATLRLAVLTWVVLATSAATAARVQGPLDDWLIEWMAVGSFLAWLVIGWVVLDRVPTRRRAADAALAALTVVVAVAGVRAAVVQPEAGGGTNDTAAALFADVDGHLATNGRPVMVTFGRSGRSGPSSVAWGAGLVLHLERRGESVAVDPRWRNQFGDRRTRPAGPAAVVLTVTTDRHQRPAGASVLADVDGVRIFRGP
jgi:hypothetical protein